MKAVGCPPDVLVAGQAAPETAPGTQQIRASTALTSYVPTAREVAALLHLASFRYLTQLQLAELVVSEASVAAPSRLRIVRRVLRRLEAHRLIATISRVIGGPGGGSARLAYFLTPAGSRIARSLNPLLPIRRPLLRGTFFMGHGLACADVLLALRRAAAANPGHELVDWQCDWATAMRCGSVTVVPDAFVRYRTREVELAAFVEVDLGTEGTRRFAGKMRQYLRLYRSGVWRRALTVWPLVLTITTSTGRATALRRVTEPLLAAQLDVVRLANIVEFDFCALADFTGAPGPLGPIWLIAGRPGSHAIFTSVPLSTLVVNAHVESPPAGQPPEEKDNDAARVSGRAR